MSGYPPKLRTLLAVLAVKLSCTLLDGPMGPLRVVEPPRSSSVGWVGRGQQIVVEGVADASVGVTARKRAPIGAVAFPDARGGTIGNLRWVKLIRRRWAPSRIYRAETGYIVSTMQHALSNK